MNSPESIDWSEAQKWADDHGQDSIIIVCRSTTPPGRTHVLTWGRTPELSADVAEGGNRIKNELWPDNGPHFDRPQWLVGLLAVFWAGKDVQIADENGSDYAELMSSLKTMSGFIRKYNSAIESKIGK